jgi:hypothetical protein
MRELFDIGAWLQWFDQLDRTFVFLLALPFVVAIVGLWAAYRERERERDEARSRPAARSRAADEDAADSSHRSPHQFGGKPHGNLTD